MKTQITKRFNDLKADVLTQTHTPVHFKKAMNVFMLAMFVCVIAIALTPTGLADYSSDIKGIAKNIYTAILGISTALAVVGESIAACMYFFSSNGKTVEAASGWMKRIGIGWIFINAMGIVVSFISSMVGSNYNWQ